MFGLFTKKPAAKPAPAIDMVTLEYHRAVVASLRSDIVRAEAATYDAQSRAEAERQNGITKGRLASELLSERDAAHDKLREINGMVTPGCAGIGRKMARAAREGLPEFAVAEAA